VPACLPGSDLPAKSWPIVRRVIGQELRRPEYQGALNATGCHGSYVDDLESGRRAPGRLELLAVALVLSRPVRCWSAATDRLTMHMHVSETSPDDKSTRAVPIDLLLTGPSAGTGLGIGHVELLAEIDHHGESAAV
jgi:hypothetical protein